MNQKTFLEDFKNFLFGRNVLSRLTLANVLIFLLSGLASLYYYLFKIIPENSLCGSPVSGFTYWLATPSNPQLLLQKPWTIFTYMFLQENFFHLLFNMIMLYFGGRLFMQFMGSRKLVSVYIIGGLVGAIFYILSYNIFPVFQVASVCSVALGASASVLAILIAMATYAPNYAVQLVLFGNVKLKYIALILVLLDLFSIENGNPGGHIAHLGGALYGFCYISFTKQNRFFSWNIPENIKKTLRNIFRKKSRLRVEYKKGIPLNDDEYNHQMAEKQKKIDTILDKISKSGYESLSREEKDLLFSGSRKN